MILSRVFISYSEQDKQHAQKLYDRLILEKIPVWFESESLLPGQNREDTIRKAIKESRLFLALLSSNSVQRGEFNKQLAQALEINKEFSENDIYIIPVKLNNCKFSNDKLELIHSADMFLNWENGFQNILKTIRQVFKTMENFQLPIAESIACESLAYTPSYIENLFVGFDSRQVIMLLAQKGRNDMIKKLKEHAEVKFGKQNVFHITPPPGSNIKLNEYFSIVAWQCGITKGVDKSVSLIKFFHNKLKNKDRIFILITSFEHSCNKGNKKLISILDHLLAHLNLNILIYGSEKLENQFFDGIFDELNIEEVYELPGLNLLDIKCKCSDDGIAEAIWQMSGGHPMIIEQCLKYYAEHTDFRKNECIDTIMFLTPIIQLFTPFKKLSDNVKQKLCCLIGRKILGRYESAGISNPLIKELYWKNFLKRTDDQKYLMWRSDILQELGNKVLNC